MEKIRSGWVINTKSKVWPLQVVNVTNWERKLPDNAKAVAIGI